jgi:hypothetical protein
MIRIGLTLRHMPKIPAAKVDLMPSRAASPIGPCSSGGSVGADVAVSFSEWPEDG